MELTTASIADMYGTIQCAFFWRRILTPGQLNILWRSGPGWPADKPMDGFKMTTKKELDIFVAMDEDGNAIFCNTLDQISEQIGEMAADNGTLAVRVVKLKIFMCPPEVQAGTVIVPDDPKWDFVAEAIQSQPTTGG